ncbi:phospholipase [Haloferax mediterranei ATCC 33500]|uniref:Phospholipase n=1 Tax=Haloferax mediterranei (strain ATCC 33500 / DSM 1411 / JCM 8866 / NBRC 14739 / NCIMB 2177 / R-4) TaxID=523841 RepID=I3R5B5_HALMT|nr:dienelactone hydrolase family protein [Haloferax mediterranei]AFK19425.2 phospholipase/carboxylesterase [Haloferax mediterranei ATCC 33500]AHZ21224.1 phospholipase [Haloferax mediterranei ATCC 33500]EMA04385.1 phospholipase/carboxylesterase [Haloferax mediterranei ATCC 33500]MDX5989530.1 dienelactone hydrolase family protein [Haloferax mediterranei ATCC 33500]QCQ75887.1 phospholipase [Haloferax mediterranei ATCC 33500]
MTEIPLEHVHVEPSEPGDGPGPAVVLLHGRGSNEQDLLQISRRFPDHLHVVSLRAPDELQGGYTWYDLDLSAGGLHQSQPHAEQFERSRELVRESIEGAIAEYDLDPERIGLLGFSQGAIASLSLLLDDPDDYAWVVALHGYLAESHADLDPDGVSGKPVFIGAGEMDQIIPASRAERAADRLRELGADVTSNVYQVPHGIGPDELADVVSFVETQV